MLLHAVVLFIIGTAFAKDNGGIPQVDNVIDNLSSQQWDADEISCRDKIFNVLNNVKNSTLWATWIWDSNAKSPYGTFVGARFHLGNYDQCLRPPWLSKHPELRTQYCLADVEMSQNPANKNWNLPGPYARAEEYYVEGGTPTGRSFSLMSYGVCLPVGCQTKSTVKYVRALLSGQHLQAAWDADVNIQNCEEAGAPIVRPMGYYVYMYTFAALALIALASTYYISEYPDRAESDTFVNHVVKSFCLRRNWKLVVKEDKEPLPCLHGIKFLTATMIVLLHVALYTNKMSVTNGTDVEKISESLNAGMSIHSDLFVDSFFAVAALLLGKTLSTMDITKPHNLLKNIAKRYIRLFGLFVVIVFYVAHVFLQKDNGPLYHQLAGREQEYCQRNWWLSLLMVGNYINTDTMCYTSTWYIPCDFHFYVITLVLLYIYRKNPKLGKIATAIVVFLGFVGPAINNYLYDLPALIFLNIGLGNDLRVNKNFTKGYIHTHIRMGPYIAGLLVGYLMSQYKPADYKKILSKTTSFLGFLAGLSLIMAVFAAGSLCYQYRVYGVLSGVFRVLHRTIYAIGVLCVIVFCTYGDVPLINNFLSWAPFKALSRLSFGIYVIHPVLLFRIKMAARGHLRYHLPDFLVESFGTVVVSLMASLAVWLLVEAPLVNFTTRYLDTRSQPKTTNGVTKRTEQNETDVENMAKKPKIL
ncbi:nose resistant to fluoxetine protein 6-like [Choristoneura fumiferana]|uniref:nose resistant to fluoxetine protein 6-like n=1 Tax=Choristoneura fumiferana TaxID=7141 RepID=UPI003D155647